MFNSAFPKLIYLCFNYLEKIKLKILSEEQLKTEKKVKPNIFLIIFIFKNNVL